MLDPLTSPLVFPAAFAFLISSILFLYVFGLRGQKSRLTKQIGQTFRQSLDEKTSVIDSQQSELNNTTEQLAKTRNLLDQAQPYQDQVLNFKDRILEMERVWLDTSSSEAECERVLADNLWVLWPDYFVDDLHRQKSIGSAVNLLFDDDVTGPNFKNMPVNPNLILDMFGRVQIGASVQPGHVNSPARDIILIVELKNPRIKIGAAQIEQTYAYATCMMNAANSALWAKQIDCLAIGGSIAEDTKDVHLRFGGSTHDAIRIIPLTYENLIDRAHVMCGNFLKICPDYSAIESDTSDTQHEDGDNVISVDFDENSRTDSSQTSDGSDRAVS